MKHIKKMVGAGVLTLALAVTGCSAGGGGGNKPNVDNSKGAADTATLPTVAWSKADYAAVKDGGTLTLAIDQLPDNWNTLQADGNNVSTGQVVDPTTGGPVVNTADGGWEVNPDYASEVKLVSQDPQVVEVKLNPKAVWEDGTPVTYKDFAATVKASSGANKAYQTVSDNVYKDIESVTREDTDYNFKITFKNKNADWPSILGGSTAGMATASILPAAIAADVKAFNEGYKSKPLPSDGPFKVSKVDTNGQVVTLTPNPKWWGEKPKLDKIIMKVVSRDGLAQAYANKELDAFSIGTNKNNYDTAKKRADGAVQQTGGLTWNHVTLNGSKGPLADVKVRQAVARAIDRKTISASRLSPIGAPVTSMNNYIYMPGQKGYQDDATGVIGFDTAKSEALLKEAGYVKGSDGIQAKDGKKLELTYTLDANNPVSEQIFKQLQANLQAVGITLKNNTVPSDKFFSDYVLKSNFEMTGFAWSGTAFPVSSTESIFYPVDSGQNFTGITDEKLGAMWQKANAELDPAKRIALAAEIDKAIFAYTPVIPLTPTPNTYAVTNGLVNYGAAQFQSIDWTKVGWKA
ncbi:ABC transporter family substrate-binding protein [Arthrobacter wenxiniae]|jgi:peptide/nickel transport system substrate-binding protein|uniref:ABC transporter family substrate-binding protein n=1 Tax=Arthrobacter wenxiniae TaxID=2713570 RepID=A0A7Y7II83_9MICC|nr:ABC transporter family substrate-binding protein [Arthrobacter wenxiniae]NVM95973.1 ABC transporter family substrate-binding protein [Arthrobacter wenxiniae]